MARDEVLSKDVKSGCDLGTCQRVWKVSLINKIGRRNYFCAACAAQILDIRERLARKTS